MPNKWRLANRPTIYGIPTNYSKCQTDHQIWYNLRALDSAGVEPATPYKYTNAFANTPWCYMLAREWGVEVLC